MKDVGFFAKIFLGREPADFRKQAHGLALLASHVMALNPMEDRALFIFTNKRRSAIKALYWDQTGYALWWKTLERDCYHWPEISREQSKISISAKELKWLLDGVDLNKIKTHEKVKLT
ncbi:MAG: IS66 family insertion sequence element accessory protein TnpB [Candidatus Pacebacteria bacterium]|nr:IS66 family insertion sequence element accessory protein TnpB [Candidatus Paceibacterota bacterium]